MGFRTKTPPTRYPRILFHGLRSAQLLSSMIVGSIMCYFIYHLTSDHRRIPWTFILLLAVSFSTVLCLAGTMALHCCYGLNPKLNLVLNSGLGVIWAVGFTLLTWYSSNTLFHFCDKENWREDAGIMICRIYKALFTFALTGFTSTIAALLLDISVFRKSNRLGTYNAMQDLDAKGVRVDAPRGEVVYDRAASPLPSSATQYRDRVGALRNPFSAKPGKNGGDGGDLGVYQVPAEQFEYDTGYQGAGYDGKRRD